MGRIVWRIMLATGYLALRLNCVRKFGRSFSWCMWYCNVSEAFIECFLPVRGVWSAVPCVTHVGRGCISWLDTASCNYSLHKSSSITLHTRCYHSFSIILSCSLCVLPSTWSHYRPVSLFTATAAWVSDKHTDHFNCLVSINICNSQSQFLIMHCLS